MSRSGRHTDLVVRRRKALVSLARMLGIACSDGMLQRIIVDLMCAPCQSMRAG
jgi:hypothetical protein